MATSPTFQPEAVAEQSLPQPKSREEVMEILRAARKWYQANFPGRDPVEELFANRRAEAAAEAANG